ncbi:alanine dehydrogenase [Candidatus Bathyarchaeota archaeon]|nr:alanine dehydrogenase [Candidatus Bathyarchaeota archaeon]MBS7613739.1 alanine dehydrogenase [Candidatus Bathyarchaeota archaeon]MBS7617921.1 alanine dehydrogenase [Candidatus Bathyarchaeota archaeon]
METLLLTDEEVGKLLSIDEVIKAVEQAFAEKSLGKVQMPAKTYLFYHKYNGDLRVMPSYLESYDISSVKIVNSHPENKVKYNLPTVMAVVILVDPKNGFPLAIMGGKTLTDIRTGAAGGIAAKYLARKNSRIIGFVGAGAQARTQLAALLELYGKFDEVRVWGLYGTAEEFAVEMQSKYGDKCRIIPVKTVKETVEGADIVVTATPSRQPLVMENMVSPGMHFNCIGADAPGKEELDPAILRKAKIVVDDLTQASHGGELNVPLSRGLIRIEDVWAEIGEIIAGLKKGRETPDEITIFSSTGLAVQDAVAAKIAYDKALKKGVGRFIKIL